MIHFPRWKQMLGTGGALIHAFDKLSDNFLVVYGDSYLQVELKDFESRHDLKSKIITVAILKIMTYMIKVIFRYLIIS